MDPQEDPLEAALANAFVDSPMLAPRTAASSSASMSTTSAVEPNPVQEAEGGGSHESWKDEYDKLSAGWRKESAAAREKAEKERERWRLIREEEEKQERERGKQAEAHSKETGWEKVATSSSTGESAQKNTDAAEVSSSHSTHRRRDSPSPADARDLVAGETSREPGIESLESLLPRPGPQDYGIPQHSVPPASSSATDDQGLSNSRTWEEVPSLDSSFPSLSFPRSSAPSPEPREPPPYQRPPAPPSVTLAIFDSSLSRRARALALLSSLAINMFLPFVNGVMLGIGEIFAKNVVVGFFGWSIPGTAVGIRTPSRRK